MSFQQGKGTEIKNNTKRINWSISQVIEVCALVVVLFLAIWSISKCFARAYTVPQDKYALRGMMFLGLSILIIQKYNFKDFRNWIPIAIILIPASRFFLTKEMLTIYRVYERDIWGLWNGQWVCYVLYLAILTDAILGRKIK